MRKILEGLYFGNLIPNDRQMRSGSDLQRTTDEAAECEARLQSLLKGDEKELLLKLMNAQSEINGNLAMENFILGFRLGLRLAVEALEEDDGSLTAIC